jgi:integrase
VLFECVLPSEWVGQSNRIRSEKVMNAAQDRRRDTQVDVLLTGFGEWLDTEGGLAGESVRCYRDQARTGAVWAIMGRACSRAGVPRAGGAHRLRHTLASDLLRAGAPLAEIGQVLRHRSQLSTTIYARQARVLPGWASGQAADVM